MGLLLLRSVIGSTIILQAVFLWGDASTTVQLLSAVAFACGGLLLLGFRTHLAGGVIALAIAALALSPASLPERNLLGQALPATLAESMALATVLLGPGAYSVDARVFGRREIIIPPRSR
jgi:hypothetical protein